VIRRRHDDPLTQTSTAHEAAVRELHNTWTGWPHATTVADPGGLERDRVARCRHWRLPPTWQGGPRASVPVCRCRVPAGRVPYRRPDDARARDRADERLLPRAHPMGRSVRPRRRVREPRQSLRSRHTCLIGATFNQCQEPDHGRHEIGCGRHNPSKRQEPRSGGRHRFSERLMR
jgi:hypothetical protein